MIDDIDDTMLKDTKLNKHQQKEIKNNNKKRLSPMTEVIIAVVISVVVFIIIWVMKNMCNDNHQVVCIDQFVKGEQLLEKMLHGEYR